MNKDQLNAKRLWDLSSLGLEFAFIFIGSIFLGNFLDKKFNTAPLCILVFLVLGFSFGMYHIIGRVNPDKKK